MYINTQTNTLNVAPQKRLPLSYMSLCVTGYKGVNVLQALTV